jgi:hypothetical protein
LKPPAPEGFDTNLNERCRIRRVRKKPVLAHQRSVGKTLKPIISNRGEN